MKIHSATSASALSLLAACASGPAPAGDLPWSETRVTFEVEGATLDGTLFVPESREGALPGVVVTGAWTTVQDQMPYRYARELAARGLVALTFDFRGFGRSGGEPRYLEDPARKSADLAAAAEFLATRSEVERVGLLGVCASAGYAVQAAVDSEAVEAVALVAPWLHDAAIVDEVYGGAEGVAALRALASDAAEAVAAGGEPTVIPATGPEGSASLMPGVPYYTEEDRGLIDAWDNRFDVRSWEGWLTFDALALAPRVQQPTLIVHSESAAIPKGARRFLEGLGAPHAQLWLEDVSQFDFYDQDRPVGEAVDAAADHLRRVLAPASAADVEAIRRVCAAIPADVDAGRFDGRGFAESVVVDYTSLWGGEAQEMERGALMAAWRGLVPGFDRTWHELGDVEVLLEGDRATASAKVDARHWIGEEVWRPAGTYRWELRRAGAGWEVTTMTLLLESEEGDRGLVERAAARVASGS